MIDQSLNTNIPIEDLREINKCRKHLDCIVDVYSKLAKRNPALEGVINSDCNFTDTVDGLEGCLLQIEEDMSELAHEDFLGVGGQLEIEQAKNSFDQHGDM